MALRSGSKTSSSATRTQDDQTSPQQTRAWEPQEEHAMMQAPPPPSRQQLILHFFRSMVQAQEQYTKNLRKGTEVVPEIAPARDQEIPTCSYCRKRGHLEKDTATVKRNYAGDVGPTNIGIRAARIDAAQHLQSRRMPYRRHGEDRQGAPRLDSSRK
ncbi:uncharacterized protein M6B38_198425 [Iris pallida]|uniref:Uncharacterized protein n=1 Tax=Iris pallida TaxID=29817 RepID=A0AAX6EB50_IRIPA|nr:uncharacterized protein M6B38_198425 [Iris pallida]